MTSLYVQLLIAVMLLLLPGLIRYSYRCYSGGRKAARTAANVSTSYSSNHYWKQKQQNNPMEGQMKILQSLLKKLGTRIAVRKGVQIGELDFTSGKVSW